MKLKNLTTLETVSLPNGLYWKDEFGDVPFEEREERSITGLLLLFQQEKLGGQPLTLASTDDKNWITRRALKKLYEWARQPALKMELSLEMPVDNRVFTVSFKNSEPPAIIAKEVIDAKPLSDEIYYQVTLKLRIHSETV